MNRLLIILIICFLLPNAGKAWQQSDWMSIFSRVAVNDVLEKGQSIWIASDAGLFEVDKNTLQVTHYNKNNSALPDFHIQTLTEDLVGNLWIGTYDLAMAMLPSNGGVWTIINYPTTQNPLLVYCSEVDPFGHIWLGTNQGLLEYDEANWTTHAVPNHLNMASGPVWELAINSQGKIFAASHSLLAYENGNWTNLSDTNMVFSYSEAYVCLENDTTVWFMNDAGEACRIAGQGLTKWNTHYSNQSPKLPFYPNTAKLKMQVDPNGHVYYYTYDGELAFYDGQQWQTDQTLKAAVNSSSGVEAFLLSNNSYYGFIDGQVVKTGTTTQTNTFLETYDFNHDQFYNDNNGNLFLVDYNHGAFQADNFAWNNTQANVPNVTGYGELEFDAQNEIWWQARINGEPVILEQQSNNSWVVHDSASTNGLFYTYNYNNQNVYFFDMEVNNAGVVLLQDNFDRILKYENGTWSLLTQLNSNQNLSDFTVDANGNFWWVENHSGGGAILKKYDGNSISSQNISPNSVMLIPPVFDDQGNLWIAGESGSGSLYKYDGNFFSQLVYEVNGANAQKIISQHGTMYLATAYDGLYLYDGTQWTHKTVDNCGMSGNEIRRMAFTANGDLWLGGSNGHIIDIWQRSNFNSTTTTFAEPAIEASLFPNPASQQVQLQIEDTNIQHIQLLNVQGQQIRELTTQKNQLIDLSNLPGGIYFVKISTEKAVQLYKLVKT